jgi:ribosomal protein S18 acetylase RimI-like enzyme
MKIRAAVEQDAEAIAEVHMAASRAAYGSLISTMRIGKLTLADRTQQWLTCLTSDSNISVLVGLDSEDTIRAFISFGPAQEAEEEGSAEIYSFYTHPDWWRKGFGDAVYSTAINQLKSTSYQRLILWVLDSNTSARTFYTKRGFTDENVRKQDTPTSPVELKYSQVLHNTP